MVVSIVSKVVGWVLVLFGTSMIPMVLGFSTVLDPRLRGAEWWATYWDRVAGAMGFCLTTVLIGAWVLTEPPSPAGRRDRKDAKSTLDDLE